MRTKPYRQGGAVRTLRPTDFPGNRGRTPIPARIRHSGLGGTGDSPVANGDSPLGSQEAALRSESQIPTATIRRRPRMCCRAVCCAAIASLVFAYAAGATEWTENWVEETNGLPRSIGEAQNCVGAYIDVPAGRGLLMVTVQNVSYRPRVGGYDILGREGTPPRGDYEGLYLVPDPGVLSSSGGMPLRFENPVPGRYFVAAYSHLSTERVIGYTLTATYFPKAPDITTQPASQTVCEGGNVTFCVAATGESLEYQWYNGGTILKGARGSCYTIGQVQPGDAGDYRVKVTNPGGSESSRYATLTVLTPPAVRIEPRDQNVAPGKTATLTAVVSHSGPISYQWYLGQTVNTSSPIENAKAASYTTPPLLTSASYWVRVSNGTCSADGQPATVSVGSAIPPQITQHPGSQTISPGQTVTLTVVAVGREPFAYQWYLGQTGDASAPETNATNATFTTPPLSASVSYWVRVSNGAGSTNSQTAILTVATAPLVPPSGMTVAYDEVRQEFLLFGGRVSGQFTNQTWVWRGGQYVQISPADSPPVRVAPNMVFDGTRQQVILFGGLKSLSAPHWNDTWAWTGTYWVELAPVSKPPSRRGQGMMFDSVRRQVVLFGGAGDGGLLSDTWLWDGQNWSEAAPAHTPPPTVYCGLAFQTHLSKGVLFGLGHSSIPEALRTSTWSWDGTDWILEHPSHSPAARYSPEMAYDAARRQTVLFGGQSSSGTQYYDETWLWDGTDWTKATPSRSPPGRHGGSMTYDPVGQRIVLVGGSDGLTLFNDTWLWDGTIWTEWFPGDPLSPPKITVQPASQWVAPGQTSTLAVVVAGTEPLAYQWYSGQTGDASAPETNATNATFTTPPLSASASYWVRVSNGSGAMNSQTAIITIGTPGQPAVVLNGTEPLGGSQYAQTIGWKFVVSAPITVTSLGVFDADADGLTAPYEVGIWSEQGSLVVSGTVPPGNGTELSYDFRWAAVSQATLAPGTYRIGTHHAGGATDPFPGSASIAQVPEVAWTNPCYAHGTVLLFPEIVQSSSGTDQANHFGPSFRFHPGVGGDVVVGDAGFEVPEIGYDRHAYDPQGSAWKFNSRSGIVHPSPADGTPIFDAPAAAEGEQVAFLQYATSAGEISQSIILPAEGPYRLSFRIAGRGPDSPTRPYDGNLSYEVLLDVAPIGSDATTSFQPFTRKSFEFQATAGTHLLSFVATSTSGDHVAFLDDVQIEPVTVPVTAPVITVQPTDQAISAGQSVTLSVAATGSKPLSYQWYLGQSGDTGAPIQNATAASYATTPLTVSASYWVRLTNAGGSADSRAVKVTVQNSETDLVRLAQWPGYRQGPALDVAVAGSYAYVASAGLHVFDVSNPARPQRVGGFDDTIGVVNNVALSGHHAYLADDWEGLQVLDISQPASPQRIGHLDTLGQIHGVAIRGNYAYVADGNVGGFRVVDISDPSSPLLVGGVDIAEDARSVALAGDHACVAYTTFDTAGLLVFDIANPSNPRQVGKFETSVAVEMAVAVSGIYAFLTGGDLFVLDIAVPATPRLVGGYLTDGYARGIAIVGDLAYVADGVAGLRVLDVSDPQAPLAVGQVDTAGEAWGVAVSGNHAYVANKWGGLLVVDISNPSELRSIGTVDSSGDARGVAVAGNYAYLADGDLQVVDVSDPAFPKRVGGMDTTGYCGVAAVSGNYALVHDETQGLTVLEITDPAHPRPLGGISISAYDVAVAWPLAYVADKNLAVLDLSDPANPRRIGGLDTDGSAEGIAVVGNLAYVATAWAGMEIIDVSDPRVPKRVGKLDTPGDARAVAVAGDHAYVADYDAGLQVVDISDPANPRRVGGLQTSGIARDVEAVGRYAYVAIDARGVVVVDISVPSNPQAIATYDTPGVAFALTAQSNRVFVADGDWGLSILEFQSAHAEPPRISGHPAPQAVAYGGVARFTVSATSAEPLGYQWSLGGNALADNARISGATGPTLTITAVEPRDIGHYQCVVTNAAGSATSQAAELRLLPTLLVSTDTPFTANGAFQFTLVVEPGKRIRVQYSTDLKDWTDLTAFDSTEAPFAVTDPGAAQRLGGFYRAVSP